jgi:hypothetical protein
MRHRDIPYIDPKKISRQRTCIPRCARIDIVNTFVARLDVVQTPQVVYHKPKHERRTQRHEREVRVRGFHKIRGARSANVMDVR